MSDLTPAQVAQDLYDDDGGLYRLRYEELPADLGNRLHEIVLEWAARLIAEGWGDDE